MSPLRVRDLPPPPADRIGWPWTVDEPSPDSGGLKVSIVTPSFNQGAYLEETIRSVLLQGYDDLEYIIIDGGSSDESVEIIRKYEPWLAYWVSEPDNGQSDAINKGFARATGQVMGWLNSDDVYAPGALHHVTRQFVADVECELVYGRGWYLDESSARTGACSWIRAYDRDLLLTFNFILQPAAFWRRSLWERVGPLDASLNWAMDWEWLIRATRVTAPCHLNHELAGWRITEGIKTTSGGERRREELAAISRTYGGRRQPTYLAHQLDLIARQVATRVPMGSVLQHGVTGARRALQQTVWRNRCLY